MVLREQQFWRNTKTLMQFDFAAPVFDPHSLATNEETRNVSWDGWSLPKTIFFS